MVIIEGQGGVRELEPAHLETKKVLEQRSSHFPWQYQPTLAELYKKRPQEEEAKCLNVLISKEHKNIVFRAHIGNSPDLLQCLFLSLKCTQSTLLVFHSSQIHSGDLLDSSLFCLIQLAKGQQDKGRILLASSGSGWDKEQQLHGFISNILRDSSGSYYTCRRSVRVIFTHTGTLLVVLQGHISHGLLQASATASVFQQ